MTTDNLPPKPLPPLAEVLIGRRDAFHARSLGPDRERAATETIFAAAFDLAAKDAAPYDAELARLRALLREAHGSLSWLASRADVLTYHADMRDEDLADLRALLERIQEAAS